MRSILPSLVIVASVLVETASAQGVFEPPKIVPLPFLSAFITNPVLGDLDQDGDLDAVISTGSGTGGFVHTFVNDGSGAFTLGPGLTGVGGPVAADLHDMNGDALPDYVLAFASVVVVFFGDGEGSFAGNTSFSPARPPNHLIAADVNGDAIPDVVATSPILPFFLIPAALQVWVGNGTSFTQTLSLDLAGTPTDLDLADVDGDGLADALVTRLGVATWHKGQAAGGFGAAMPIAGAIATTRLAAGDLDADGDIDLVLGGVLPQVQTLVNDGSGGFAAGQLLLAGVNGASPALADVDADGALDIVLDDSGDGSAGQLVIWRGLGGGAFEEDVHVTAGGEHAGGRLLAGDLDGDGRVDVLTESGGTAVYLNRTYGAGSPFLDLGFALPGSHGYPVQIASGTLTVGTPFSIALLNGLPGAPATLVVGASAAFIPHKGGVMVPSPDLLLAGFPIDAQGAFTLAGNWPPGLPSGASLYLQWWFKDSNGPTPKAASSGLRLTTP